MRATCCSAGKFALRRLLALCAAAMALACASCGGGEAESADGRKKVSFLTMQLRPTFDDFFRPLIEQYEREHPDVDIEWVDYPWLNYETKLMTAFLAHRAPDVINLPSESLPSYVKTGTIRPIDDIVDPTARAEYVQSLLTDAGVYDGKLYAVPWYAAPEVAFVNTDILKEAGMTLDDVPRRYEDLPAFCRAIRDRTGKFGYYPIYTEGGKLRVFLWERGVPLASPDGRTAAFDTPEGVETLRFWTDLYRDGLVPRDAVTATHRIPLEQYKAGKLAILTVGPQLSRQFKSDTPEIYDATEVVSLPRWEGRDQYLVSLFTFAINARARHPEEAMRFAEFLTNGPNQLAFAKRTITLPSTTAALDDPFFAEPEDTLQGRMFRVAADQTRKGQVFRPLRNHGEAMDVLTEATEAVMLGRATPEEALADAKGRVDEILSR